MTHREETSLLFVHLFLQVHQYLKETCCAAEGHWKNGKQRVGRGECGFSVSVSVCPAAFLREGRCQNEACSGRGGGNGRKTANAVSSCVKGRVVT